MRKVPSLLMSLAVLSGIVYFFRLHKPGIVKITALVFLAASLLGFILVFIADHWVKTKH